MEEEPYELSVGNEELVEDWRSMLRKITTDSKWCKMIASKDRHSQLTAEHIEDALRIRMNTR